MAAVSAFQPNVLSNFNSYSYHIALILPDEPNGKTAGIDDTSGIIIAETGKTANFYIDKLVLNTMAPANPDISRESTILSGELTILEPLSFTFFDRYFAAAEIAGWKSISDMFFYLKISFNGWNEDGSPAPRMSPTYLKITKTHISTAFDINGSKYTVEFTGVTNLAMEEINEKSFRSFKSEISKTLDGTIKNFEKEFNKSIKHTQDSTNSPPDYDGDIYKFSLGPYLSEKSLDMKIDPDAESVTTSRDSDGKIWYKYDGVTNIQTSLKEICNTSQDIEDLMYPNLDENKNIDIEATPGVELARYYSIDLEVSYGKFIHSLHRYQRIFEYQIDLVPKPEIEKTPNGTTNQQARADAYTLISEGILVKRYDYYFTGKNTEVLDAKFDFNTSYSDIANSYSRKEREYYASITQDTREAEQGLGNIAKSMGGSFSQSLAKFSGLINGLKRGERYLEDIDPNLTFADVLNFRLAPVSDPNKLSKAETMNDQKEDNADKTKDELDSRAYKGRILPLLSSTLVTRGDPYWIDAASIRGRNPLGANFNSGTLKLYFKMKMAQPHDPNTGMYSIIGKNTVSAIYNVTTVVSTFESGKFTQEFNLTLDNTVLGVEFK